MVVKIASESANDNLFSGPIRQPQPGRCRSDLERNRLRATAMTASLRLNNPRDLFWQHSSTELLQPEFRVITAEPGQVASSRLPATRLDELKSRRLQGKTNI